MIYSIVIAVTMFVYVHSFNWISKMYLSGQISDVKDLIKMFQAGIEPAILGS